MTIVFGSCDKLPSCESVQSRDHNILPTMLVGHFGGFSHCLLASYRLSDFRFRGGLNAK